MAIGIPIAPGRSQAAARLEEAKALALRDEPLFMDLWTWLFREARGSGVQRPAPLRTRASPSQASCPLSSPPSPLHHTCHVHRQNRVQAPICVHPLRLHHARGRSHEAFRKRRACRSRPHMYVRAAGALSCEAVCGATGERVLVTPVYRRLLERPSPRRRRAGQPRRVGRGGCLR